MFNFCGTKGIHENYLTLNISRFTVLEYFDQPYILVIGCVVN